MRTEAFIRCIAANGNKQTKQQAMAAYMACCFLYCLKGLRTANWDLWGDRDSFAADVYSSYASSLSLRSWLFKPFANPAPSRGSLSLYRCLSTLLLLVSYCNKENGQRLPLEGAGFVSGWNIRERRLREFVRAAIHSSHIEIAFSPAKSQLAVPKALPLGELSAPAD